MESKLLHGDCLELMKDIPDNSIDMVLTDPPYGTTACKWDTVIDFELMWKELKRITKDNGAICLFGSEPFSSALRMSNIKMFKYDWIWEKTRGSNFASLKHQPWKMHEIVSVFNAKSVYSPQKYKVDGSQIDKRLNVNNPISNKDGVYGKITRTRKRDDGTRYPKSIIKIKNPNNKTVHPTQKPVALLEYLIKTYTLENETVLDFTMGSGSTGVACKNLNRKFIGIEQDDNYFQIASDRINVNKPKENI